MADQLHLPVVASIVAQDAHAALDERQWRRAWRKHTGSRASKDDLRCMRVAALKLLGASDRQVAALVHCDVRSIRPMLERAERSGLVPGLKDRLVRLIGASAEEAAIVLRQLLQEAEGNRQPEVAAMIKAVATALGVATDKLMLLTGQATEIIERRDAAPAQARKEFEDWWRASVVDVQAVTNDSGVAHAVQECEDAHSALQPVMDHNAVQEISDFRA